MEQKLYLYNDKTQMTMATVDLKKSVLTYIDHADERLLKMIKALVESYQEDQTYELTDAQKTLLDERIASHKANPDSGTSWDELKSELRSKYGA